ncbi:hypothetical protein LTR36_001966 [Oleoguttula mirabilis]|uniref:Major facilitator superfamily (MFS) profile domain-containing protein n=1 Tax=Oleoguttula mirabilis TaxID=1507867 RepID=A0AAV9JL96_9PEZI|nr:hypothetical protein LTR36_001966 [Oleoguttula mirabilis]
MISFNSQSAVWRCIQPPVFVTLDDVWSWTGREHPTTKNGDGRASTEDGGIAWSHKNSLEANDAVDDISIDPKEEAKLLAKLDLFFVPIIMLVYLSCFLDRSNIGNVKVAGMPEDIHATADHFSTAVSIFYATYVVSETPWAVLLKKLTPRLLLSSLAVGFIIQNIRGLYATRLILGACEGGLFPGLNLYLTMVYRREEQAKHVSYLFVCTAISGAFGGLVAYAILHMDGVDGVAGWKWVYIIEGLFSIVVAAAVFFGLPNDPSNAYFLRPEEKELMRRRSIQRAAYIGNEDFSWEELRIALKDPKVYLSGLLQFCQDILLYGFSTFLPSIIKGMGYDTYQTQYLTIPVYAVGGLAFFVLLANVFGIVGYILLLSDVAVGVKYFGTVSIPKHTTHFAPHYRRATAIGMQQTIGNTAGIVAGQIYRKSPYTLGNAFSLGAICVSQFIIVGKLIHVRACNKKKEAIASGERSDDRTVKTGDWALDFEYHL